MNKEALKAGALMTAVVLVVFEAVAGLVQLVDPQGGLLRVDYSNPVQHVIILAAALGFGVCACIRKNRKDGNGPSA